jgi:hypothetical protein
MHDGEKPIHFFLFNTETSPEEISYVINNLAPEQDISDDEVPDHPREDQNAVEIDYTHQRVLDPDEEPNRCELPPS